MKLKELKATYFESDKKYDFLLPLGSTEQHGPFIPFGTDTYIVDAFLDSINQKFPELIILPILEYTCAEEHRGYYGTIWLHENLMSQILSSICDWLKSRARYIFLLNWHGGNIKFIDSFILVAKTLFPGLQIVTIPMYDEVLDSKTIELLNGPIDEHAGNTEISLMLNLEPNLVQTPTEDYPKSVIHNAWDENNLSLKSHDGIVDNHPQWVVSKELWDQLMSLHTQKIIEWLHIYLG